MSDDGLRQSITELCRAAKAASRKLATAGAAEKNALLGCLADLLDQNRKGIAEANRQDMENGRKDGLKQSMLDRLELTPKVIDGMIQGVRQVMALEDPVGAVLRDWTQPNGLRMQKVCTPIGVIGIIYESRPNVTVDAGILCLKTGNATILRGGREAFHSNQILGKLMQEASVKAGFPAATTTVLPTVAREAIPILCSLNEYIDLMIPRGGHGLIETVVEHARMPVIKHFHGVCHVYVHAAADLDMAENILINSKCQRPSACNAAETLLVDRAVAAVFLPRAVKALRSRGVRVLGDTASSKILGEKLDVPENWTTEYLDLVMAVCVVENMEDALQHLDDFGSDHSDTIVTQDPAVAEKFLHEVDSAAVYWNASTRFTDGGEFGFGAEIGISTDKIHARGPMGLQELTSYKYVVRGSGQIRG